MTHQELIQSPEYWITRIQYEFFSKVTLYLEEHQMSRSDLASQRGVSKSYITQILNGNASMSLEKMIEISLAIGYYPKVILAPIDKDGAFSGSKIEDLMESVAKLTSEYEKKPFSVCSDKFERDFEPSSDLSQLSPNHEIVA